MSQKKAFLNLYLVSHDSPICRTLVAFETEDSLLQLLSKVTVTIAQSTTWLNDCPIDVHATRMSLAWNVRCDATFK